MKLREMKVKVLSLIEEYYPTETTLAEDEDVKNKINGVINQIMLDLMPLRKLEASTEIEVAEDDDKKIDIKDFIDDLYQIDKIYFEDDTEYEMLNSTTIKLPDNYTGTFTVYYYKFPELVKLTFDSDDASAAYDNRYTFELDEDLLEVMPYGVAADLLKMDMISNYGQYFYNRYLEMKQRIDSRRSSGSIRIVGGYDL